MARITKAQVLAGKKDRRQVPVESMEGEFTIRPLTESEQAQVWQIVVEGLSSDGVKSFNRASTGGTMPTNLADIGLDGHDLGLIAVNNRRADAFVVATGLSCDGEEWTADDVDQLPKAARSKLSAAIFDLSGMTKEVADAARRFRGDAGGGRDTDPERPGLSSGNDSGRDDPDTKDRADDGGESAG